MMFRHLGRVMSLALVVAPTVALSAAGQGRAVQRPPDVFAGVTVYEDVNYGGNRSTFVSDVPDLRRVGFNDRISSIVVPRGQTWEFCQDPNYRGRCTTVTGNVPNLRDWGWNDKISSLRRVRDAGTYPGGGVPTLELYAGTDYSGQRKVITGAVDNFRDIGFNDRAVSVRVRPGDRWELCVNADYDDCRVVDRSVPDLNAIGLRRLVSSARPRGFGRGGRGFPPMPPVRQQIILFDRENFGGTSMVISDSTSSLGRFNNRARSLQVLGGTWEVCDSERFRGRCEVVTGSVRDLRTLRLDSRIESVRPR